MLCKVSIPLKLYICDLAVFCISTRLRFGLLFYRLLVDLLYPGKSRLFSWWDLQSATIQLGLELGTIKWLECTSIFCVLDSVLLYIWCDTDSGVFLANPSTITSTIRHLTPSATLALLTLDCYRMLSEVLVDLVWQLVPAQSTSTQHGFATKACSFVEQWDGHER
ncbi:uncharacterized protein LOC126470491 [Schistocerca serialis cubense]|uniref:uncharacterized protein LOC126470491 n=1 Tax=Schistocerca serialis cubense TaxID=2023355 RepID=UPI00214F1C29|nr:uncharacterized protein LOC126470491 [Schistocerca serialis cubense]